MDLDKAHQFSIRHKKQLINDTLCGCFYCLRIYPPSEISEWVDDGEDHTAICPNCGIDSVIGQSAGFPITTEFLAAMRRYFF